MSIRSSIDRDSFQQLLASAFAVQESRMDTQSLSAIIEIQRLLAEGDLNVDAAAQLIANHTRNVARAAGVAIGLLQGHQLVYRAGIGSAAPYAGRHLTATLSVAADTRAGREILRVENARTDASIEAAVCRQFGAESLLIMPIYQGQAMTGVLEVLFSEAHAFQDREVRAYRLMAGLLGEALSRAAHGEEKASAAELSTWPLAVQAGARNHNSVPETEDKHGIYRFCEAAMALAGKLPEFWRLPGAATMVGQRMRRLPVHTLQWSGAIAAVVALVIFVWTATGARRAAPSALQTSARDQQVTSASAKPAPTSTSRPQTAPGAAQTKKAAASAFQLVRVGPNEVDYVADDVTVRYFTHRQQSRRVPAYNQVEIGKDVTVRYFRPVPVASAAQPVSRTLPEAEKSVPAKLAR